MAVQHKIFVNNIVVVVSFNTELFQLNYSDAISAQIFHFSKPYCLCFNIRFNTVWKIHIVPHSPSKCFTAKYLFGCISSSKIILQSIVLVKIIIIIQFISSYFVVNICGISFFPFLWLFSVFFYWENMRYFILARLVALYHILLKNLLSRENFYVHKYFFLVIFIYFSTYLVVCSFFFFNKIFDVKNLFGNTKLNDKGR